MRYATSGVGHLACGCLFRGCRASGEYRRTLVAYWLSPNVGARAPSMFFPRSGGAAGLPSAALLRVSFIVLRENRGVPLPTHRPPTETVRATTTSTNNTVAVGARARATDHSPVLPVSIYIYTIASVGNRSLLLLYTGHRPRGVWQFGATHRCAGFFSVTFKLSTVLCCMSR